MILVIDLCFEKLHSLEFVLPVCKILEKEGVEFKIIRHLEFKLGDLKGVEKVIFCGTSLADCDYLNHLGRFEWVRDFEGPILGICAGMQVICLSFLDKKKSLLKSKLKIGFYFEDFKTNFLGLVGRREVYHLHQYFFDLKIGSVFKTWGDGREVLAIKHLGKEIYGCSFHPEVRNWGVVVNFLDMGGGERDGKNIRDKK